LFLHTPSQCPISAPTHCLVAILAECFVQIGLGEHVSWLVFTVNCIDGNLAPINVVSEVVILNIDVFGSWVDLGHGGDLDCAAVVFKNPAVDSWLGAAKSKAQSMEFLDHFHDGDGCAESHTEADELAFHSAECNFGLQLGCPVKWAASIHDDVAVSGPSGVRVFCIILVPVSSKVCINIDVE